ncbi:MAG: response regulator [Acidobacteriota bacterium]|jgi:DNA-binding NtrC family response regulator
MQRILAVDDEVHMLRLLERIISEKTPYPIVTTNNPLEVPKLLEKEGFDLILTDLKMPGLDGMDILRSVKEQGRSEEIIILTAFGSLETAIEALSNDVFDYITKPFKKEQILFTVNKAMRWQRLKREAAATDELFGREPYAEAEKAFQAEYLRRLGERCDGDPEKMAQRSGLSDALVAARGPGAGAGRG